MEITNELGLRVLTVGDGDLTYSLSLKRAYPKISVTASTLLSSPQDLIQTYSNSNEIMNEFQNVWNETILFGVDATKLETTLIAAWNMRKSVCAQNGANVDNIDMPGDNDKMKLMCSRKLDREGDAPKFDIIIFNHPHLGDAALQESEKLHAQRHHSLLCHYFHSAKQFTADDNCNTSSITGRIHVCLCGTQPQTWGLTDAAGRNGLVCSVQEKTASPVHKWLFNHHKSTDERGELIMEASHVQSHYKAPRKYRNGKLGSKHFLGRYGYRHRRTGGDLFTGNDTDMIVEQSINFVFQKRRKEHNDDQGNKSQKKNSLIIPPADITKSSLQCNVCGMIFKSKNDLRSHLLSPATPDIMIEEGYCNKKLIEMVKKKTKYNSNNGDENDPNNCETKNDTKTTSTCHKTKPIHFGDNQRYLEERMKVLIEASVSSCYSGKRLRWCCRQDDFPISKFVTSKKHCETLITSGRVFVNKMIALDSSRVLKTGDIVTLINEMKDGPTLPEQVNHHGVEIVKMVPTFQKNIQIVIAFKPVGIRTVGTFSSQTLEMIVTQMVKKDSSTDIVCDSITKLDTGCAGLCVLTVETQNQEVISNQTPPDIISDISYNFTALVHGSVPSDWNSGIFIKIPEIRSRRWNNKQKELRLNSPVQDRSPDPKCENKNSVLEISSMQQSEGDWVFMKCNQRLNNNVNDSIEVSANISTVTVKSNFDSGRLSNLFCFLLRKIGFPVVNDRFCKRELSSLPRVMRNILKNKLCIGCYDVEVVMRDIHKNKTIVNANIEPQSRTLCSYWENILLCNLQK